MLFRQLFDQDSSTYSYLLADAVTREAVLIDPVFEQYERDRTLIEELQLELRYVLPCPRLQRSHCEQRRRRAQAQSASRTTQARSRVREDHE